MIASFPKPELLAPAGNPEKLEIAIHYGADAVYLAGKDFSLRNFSGNFSVSAISRAIDYAHRRGVRVYVAVNVYSRNFEQAAIEAFVSQVAGYAPDALIISDPGILRIAQRIAPEIPVHLSTQANTTNYNSALFWQDLGIKRITLARELSLEEIQGISEHCALEIEAFVHGAMCISYSGRCLLSSFMTRRDGNRGMCSHPCRWRYRVVEETRPGKFFPIAEDDRNCYLFNARDLCMIEHLPEMVRSGIHSLKIEGRMKGINYLGATVKAYREAIDACYHQTFGVPEDLRRWRQELSSVSHRAYCTGFYFGNPDQVTPNYDNSTPASIQTFLGKVIRSTRKGEFLLDTRNKLFAGESVQVLPANGPVRPDRIESIRDEAGNSVPFAQPNQRAVVTLSGDYAPNDLIRRP